MVLEFLITHIFLYTCMWFLMALCITVRFYFIDPVLYTRQLLLLEELIYFVSNSILALGVLCNNATRHVTYYWHVEMWKTIA